MERGVGVDNAEGHGETEMVEILRDKLDVQAGILRDALGLAKQWIQVDRD
jgi:hypothetical protein